MTTLQRIFFILLLASCQMANNREASRAQGLLGEAELLLEARQLSKAKEKASDALAKLATLTS